MVKCLSTHEGCALSLAFPSIFVMICGFPAKEKFRILDFLVTCLGWEHWEIRAALADAVDF